MPPSPGASSSSSTPTPPRKWRAGGRVSAAPPERHCLPVLLLDRFPERVFIDDLAILERVEVAAVVVEHLAGRALPGHRPIGHRVLAAGIAVEMFPGHLGNLLEPLGKEFLDCR